ncbi:hypothetical protein JCM5353_002758 [Sporobolomyces roseus]
MSLTGSDYAEAAITIASWVKDFNHTYGLRLFALIRGRAGPYVWRRSLNEYAYNHPPNKFKSSSLWTSLYKHSGGIINLYQSESDNTIEVTIIGWPTDQDGGHLPNEVREERAKRFKWDFEHLLSSAVDRFRLDFRYQDHNARKLPASKLLIKCHRQTATIAVLTADLPVLLVDVLLRMSQVPQENIFKSRDWEVLELIYTMSRSVEKHGDSNIAVVDLTKPEGKAAREISEVLTHEDFAKIKRWIDITFGRLRAKRGQHEEAVTKYAAFRKTTKSRIRFSRKSNPVIDEDDVADPGDFAHHSKLYSLNYLSQFFLVSRAFTRL